MAILSNPHDIKVYWHSPAPIFAARVNHPSAVTYPIANVPFDGVTTGAYTDVAADMLVTFGSAAGLDDYGRTRARAAATSGVLKIGRSSQGYEDGQVNIVDNAYITVYEDYRVWAKIPVIGADYNEYKDADIPVGDNTEYPPPVCNMGGDFAGSIDPTTGKLTVFFAGSASYAVADGASITDYAWEAPPGVNYVNGTVATDADVYIEFDAGVHWVKLTVMDSNNKINSGYRLVVADDPENSVCVSGMQVQNITRTPRGNTARLRVLQELPRSSYPDGAKVLIWQDRPNLDGVSRDHILFTGFHQSDEASSRALETHLQRETQLTCVDVLGRLDSLPGFPQRVEVPVEGDTMTWGHMPTANMDKFLCYLLHWHSTAGVVADFYTSGTWDEYPFVLFDSAGATLYEQLQRQANRIVPDHNFTCDRYGAMRVVVNPQYQDAADRTATVQNSLTEQAWSEISFGYLRPPRVHWLRGSALLTQSAWIIDDDDEKQLLTPVFAIAPGTAPGQGGREMTLGERLAKSQTDLNSVTGHHYARANARYGDMTVTLNLNADPWDFDPAAHTWVQLITSSASAPQRTLDFTSLRCLCKEVSIDYTYSEEGTTWRGRVVLERETEGLPALTETHEEALPVGEQPVVEPVVVDAPDYGLTSGVDNIVAVSDNFNFFKTANFQTSPPTWAAHVDNFGNLAYWSFSARIDPFSPYFLSAGNEINAFVATYQSIDIYRDISAETNSEARYYGVGWFDDAFPDGNDLWRSVQISSGEFLDEGDNPWVMVASYAGYSSVEGALLGVSVNYSKNGGWSSWFGSDGEQDTEYDPMDDEHGGAYLKGIPVAGGYDTAYSGDYPYTPIGLYLSHKTAGLAYVFAYPTTGSPPTGALYKSTDWGETWATVSGVNPGHSLGHSLHVPRHDNPDDLILYHGYVDRTSTLQYRLHRVVNGVSTEISPVDNGIKYGVAVQYNADNWEGVSSAVQFGGDNQAIDTFAGDRKYVVMAGMGNDTTSSHADDLFAVFVSDDYGDTWTRITTPVGPTAPFAKCVAFSTTDPNVIFIWGHKLYIAYTSNFGASVQDKMGNLHALESLTHEGNVLAIAGGPTA